MSQNQNLNQFGQLPIKGSLDLGITKSGVISGVVSASQSTALVPGQRVKLDTAADISTPSFVAAAYNEGAIGIVIQGLRKSPSAYSATVGEAIEVALTFGPCSCQYMESSAAISAGAKVETLQATVAIVAPYATTNNLVGYALDGCSAAGKLIRVLITRQTLA